MPPSTPPTPMPVAGGRLKGWLQVALLFLVINVVFGTESYLLQVAKNPDYLWLTPTLYFLPFWLPWILLAPAVAAWARRYRLDRPRRGQALAMHGLGLVLTLLAHLCLMACCIALLNSLYYGAPLEKVASYFRSLPLQVPVSWALRNLLVFGVILAVSNARSYREELRAREDQAVRLQGQLAQAQLGALKAQLHPHFLFNALNAISTLMRTDLASAERMLELLAELLRQALRESDVQEVTLARELDFLARYLEVERMRFSDRLTVALDVAPGAERACVPHLILQPLVENALRHGLGPKVGPGVLRIAAEREAEWLVLRVEDDGVGEARRRDHESMGLGLANTRARLEQLHGGAASLTYGPRPEGGYRAELRLPWKECTAS